MDQKIVFIYEGTEYKPSELHNLLIKSMEPESVKNDMSKYHTTPEKLRDTIKKYGVAIIPKVLTEKECSDMLDGVWSYFEHITQDWPTPLSRKNKDSWREFSKLYPLHNMLVQHHQVGHAQVSWDIRQNPNVVNIFAKLWDVDPEELLVSFDGMSFALPPETTNRGWFNKTWYHVDQSFTRNEFECVQSWVTALDVKEGDATLAVLEKSNRYHEEFANKFNVTDKADWYKFEKEQECFYLSEKGCKEIRITCGKGDMILWDSRVCHCGVEAKRNRKTPNFRSVIYLCYTPRILATESNLKKKKKAFDELRSTTHYPHKSKLFAKSPRTYGQELLPTTPINPPVLTALGKKLAGY